MDLLSVAEFARAHGVTRQAVYQWMRKTPGFKPSRIGQSVALSPEDCRAILARPKPKTGRPKKVVDKRKRVV